MGDDEGDDEDNDAWHDYSTWLNEWIMAVPIGKFVRIIIIMVIVVWLDLYQ